MSILSKLFNNKSASTTQSDSLSDEEKTQLKNEIDDLNELIDRSEGIQKANYLNMIGSKYQKLGLESEAIKAFESSLKLNEDFGPAFDALLQLYNGKRKKAAFAKNDTEIQKWINKTDVLTALSKKIMRTK